MRVLLTGASGFVGSHVLIELLEQEIPVAILLRSSSDVWRIQSHLDQVTIIRGELTRTDQILPQISKFSPDTLINLAWNGVENKFRNDSKQITENLKLIEILFEIAKNSGIRSFIGIGSQAEYGPRNAITGEEDETLPSTLYGVAKLSAFHLLKVLCQANDIRFAWLRIFSSYGPKDNPDWFIPYLIKQFLIHETPKLTKGEQLWDYIYVSDAANAIIKVANTHAATGVFNLGSGKINTVKYIAETIRDIINPTLPIDFGAIPYRSDQVMHLQANVKRLEKMVGWQPAVSLEDGIEKTIEWCKSYESRSFR